jgi:uncharacterized protein (DUF433 family)
MNASLLNRITIEAGKCGGKPCIRACAFGSATFSK